MSVTNIVISERQLKTTANRLHAAISSRIAANQNVSYGWILEALSRGMFNKPYGEVRATMLASERVANDTGNTAPRVVMLEYKSDVILTLDGQYVSGSFLGTDMEIPVSALRSQADTLAGLHNSAVAYVELSELLGEHWETDDIIELAQRLGYFRYKRPLHELVDSESMIIFKGCARRDALNGDWLDDLSSRLICREDWRSVVGFGCVWSPEFHVGFDKYEMYFSLGDLGQATEFSEGRWTVTESCSGQSFEFTVISG